MKNKRKILMLILCLFTLFTFTSCNVDRYITKVSEEAEYSVIENTITDVYEKVEKACVGVYATSSTGAGTGSAVCYKKVGKDYYFVTNEHVVKNATAVSIYLGGTAYYPCSVLGSDATNDIAVLILKEDVFKFDVDQIDFMNYEHTDILKKGQTVIAIGCPLGLENYNNLTSGVVSHVTSSTIGIDAAINPGNSGGGLFNLEGKLIGINFEKEVWSSTSGDRVAVEGMGYAIALPVVKNCIEKIEAKQGNVERPLIGVTVTAVNRYLAIQSGANEYVDYLPSGVDFGLVVVELSKDILHATNAGIKTNDVILKANNYQLKSLADLSDLLHLLTVDDTITLSIYRSSTNEYLDITVNLK